MKDGRAAIVLLDPAHFEGVAFGLNYSFQFRRIWISCRNRRARRHVGIFSRAGERFCQTNSNLKITQKP